MSSQSALVDGRLPDNYINEITLRKNRFMSQWTGTAGSLAADCHWLMVERKQILEELHRMSDSLQEANARLRGAVEARLAAGGAADAACCEGGRCHPAAVDTQGPLIDVDQAIADDDDRTADSPFVAVAGMGQGQMERAWAAVRARYDEAAKQAEKPQQTRVFGVDYSQDGDNEAERLLLDALETVRDRRKKYGPPLEHFRRTVGAINAIFADKLREPLTPEDWAQFMILDKLARHQERAQRDNPVDGCGYAACWSEVMGRE